MYFFDCVKGKKTGGSRSKPWPLHSSTILVWELKTDQGRNCFSAHVDYYYHQS